MPAAAFPPAHAAPRRLRAGFRQRFGRYGAAEAARLAAPGRPIWIQAVSVGELAVAFSFMAELRGAIRRPVRADHEHVTGHALGAGESPGARVTLYFPMDVPSVVKRGCGASGRRRRLIENELWHNLIRHARRQGIPTGWSTAASPNTLSGLQKIKFITRACCQRSTGSACRPRPTATACWRWARRPTGSKWSAARSTISKRRRDGRSPRARRAGGAGRARRRAGLGGRLTWAGEEEACWTPTARPNRAIRACCGRWCRATPNGATTCCGHPRARTVRRPAQPVSRRRAAAGRAPDVLLVDTTGELRGFYAAADLVFVGKSLTQTGGQNPIEPERDGKPILVGPHMENFAEVARDFQDAGAWVQVADAAETWPPPRAPAGRRRGARTPRPRRRRSRRPQMRRHAPRWPRSSSPRAFARFLRRT